MTFPTDIKLTSVGANSCGNAQSCSVSGQTLSVTVSQSASVSFTYSFTIPNVKNPNSMRPSGTFSNIQCNVKDSTTAAIFKVSTLSSSSVVVTNQSPANILKYSISQNTTVLQVPATYTFTMTPSNFISSTGSLKLTWPSIVTIYSNVTATITTDRSYTSAFTVSTSTREILFKNVFPSNFMQSITISLSPVTNPKDPRKPAAFKVNTYDDANQQFQIDLIGDNILYPSYACDFPCATCNPSNKTDCYSCWSDLGLPFLYKTLFNTKYYGTCLSSCPSGYTTNGATDKSCTACDVSCATCVDNSAVGDKNKCLTCNPLYPFRSPSDYKCLTSCSDGYYQIDSKTCGVCSSSCQTCSGTSSYCTTCKAVNGLSPYVLDGSCVTQCPTGYTGVNNQCVKCQSPCVTCAGSPTKCLSCNTTTAAKFFYSYNCYTNCPEGTTTNTNANTCDGCKPGCSICDSFDQATCVKCSSGLLLFQGQCMSSCPSGYQVNFLETGCEMASQYLADFPTLYFPFLIICLLMTVVVFIGYIREKKSLIITNIIAICGPIEFVAFLCLTGLSFIFSTWRYAALAIAAIMIYIALNVAYAMYFSLIVAKHDPEFRRWISRYSKTYTAILILSGIFSFKLLKMYYSFFFGNDAHKANFSNKTHIQKSMIAFTAVHMFLVNGLVLVFDVSGVLKYASGTQFYYSMIETAVISILMIILELIEFIKLKDYLKDAPAYQQVYSDSVMNVSDMDDKSFDKKMREDMLKNIMGKVKANQDLFLNNKLDDLFSKFGNRRCKSMSLFENDKESDPRMTKSEPHSPTGEATFDKDAYMKERFEDNVYAEAQPPNPLGKIGKTYNDADTQVRSSDMDKILARKGGDFVNFEGSESTRRKDKKNKRRGRKNQYYTQIDAEDDEEVENNDDGLDGDDLDIIKEEDEQEQQRQKEEKKRLKEQQEQEEQERKRKQQEEEEEQQKRIIKEQEEKALREKQENKEKERMEEQQRLEEQKNREEQEKAQKLEEERVVKEQEELERKRQEELAKQQIDQQQEMFEIEDAGKGDQQVAPDHKKLSSHVPLEADPVHAIPENMSDLQSDKAGIHKDVLIEDSLNDFSKRLNQPESEVQAPPDAQSRNFNENDILGDFDRDEKGNVIVLQDENGNYVDKQGRRVNERGYLIEQSTGDIIENQNNKKMFDYKDMDERGEIPAPFCVEKHNFNPFLMRGNFDHDKQGKPLILQNKQKELVDKNGHRVNKNGWLIDQQGNICDIYDRKKFDRKQLQNDELPKLFNYNGRRFDIMDVCGTFDKDQNGAILMRRNKNGQLTDNLGRLVNEKGYLIDQNENIINKEGKKIFDKKHLKNGDFPKIFPFTKFKIKNVMGNFEMDPLGNPILDRNANGDLIDRDGKIVNKRGYYINANGDVIDKYGKVMFDKDILDEEGEIPKVFRTGLLKSDTASSLSRLMSEIERNQPFEGDSEHQRIQSELQKYKNTISANDQNTARRGSAGTSLDSMMGDTPSNYNIANQRFEQQQKIRDAARVNRRNQMQIQEEEDSSVFDDGVESGLGKRRIKKKKKVQPPQQYKDPSDRDLMMAKAYGGLARGQPKRQQIMQNNKQQSNRMMTADSGHSKDQQRNLSKLAGSISGYQKDLHNQSISRDILETHNFRDANVTNHSFLEGTNEPSIMAVPDHHIREQRLKQRKMNELKRKNKVAAAGGKRKVNNNNGVGGDPDFEKMFGKDIDEFLEDSDWDIESFGKMSNFSKGTSRSAFGDGRIRGLESIYLQRIETSMKKGGIKGLGGGSKQQQQSKAKFRVMQDRFMDDLDQIQHDNNARNEMSSGVSQSRLRNNVTAHGGGHNRFMESANTTAMGQQRSDANIFSKVRPIPAANQTQYNRDNNNKSASRFNHN